MKVTFQSKIKFTLLAGGLLASGALVVGQQAGTVIPEASAHAASAIVPANHAGRSGAFDDDEAAVARVMGQLDLDLLADELGQLRNDVELALREKLRAERKNSGDVSEAQNAYKAANASYLAKARELRAAQRRLDNAKRPAEPARDGSASLSTTSENRVIPGPSAVKSGPDLSVAHIGSINLDTVFSQYEKVKVSNEEFGVALVAREKELMRLKSDADEEAQILSKMTPGTDDHKRHEDRVTELRARLGAARERAQREFAQRKAEALAAHFEEIQQTVAALAKAKGLTYVVKVSTGLRPESLPSDLTTALNCSVVYADPRNDLTHEVVRVLNQKFKAAGTKISR